MQNSRFFQGPFGKKSKIQGHFQGPIIQIEHQLGLGIFRFDSLEMAMKNNF